MFKNEILESKASKTISAEDDFAIVDLSLKPIKFFVIALVFVSLFLFYAVDLTQLYPNEFLFELSFLFVMVAFIVIFFLFFFVDGFSLALALLVPYMIFIGGRVVVLLVTGDMEVFHYTYFTEYYPNSDEGAKLIIQAAVGYLSITIGYLLVFFGRTQIKQKTNTIANNNLNLWGCLLLAIAMPILVIELFDKLNLVRLEGYAALYQDQTNAYTGSLLSSGLTLLSLSLSLCLSGSNQLLKKIAFLTYAFVYIILGVIGQRGPVFSLLILVVGLVVYKKKLKQKLIYIGLAIIGSLILIELFSAVTLRDYALESRYSSSILNFLYEQGGTLSIYGISLDIPDYPFTAYIQNFVPGFAVVSNLFGYPFSADQLSFGSFLSKTLNENLYNQGQGIGWSLLGDAVQFFGHFYLIFLMVLGAVLGYIDSKKEENYFYFGLWILILAKISFLPRASIGSIIVPITYYIIIWIVIYTFSRFSIFRINRRLSNA